MARSIVGPSRDEEVAEMAVAGTAQVQGELWSERSLDWADVQESQVRPLYDAVLERTGIGPETTLLDVGCGAGLFCSLAAAAGAVVSGIDAAPAMLAIARERVPQGTFEAGEMEELPFGDQTFDVVTGFNSFQFAADPVNAVGEAARVARQHAPLVIAVWGEPQECEAAAYLSALAPLMPPAPPGTPGPFALSEPGAVEGLARQAGLEPTVTENVACPWEYPDLETALRGLLAAGPAVRAIHHSGEGVVIEAATAALEPFKDAQGGYRLENVFRFCIASG